DWLPKIALDALGNSYITWYGSDGSNYDIYWVKISNSGTPEMVRKISTHEDNIGHYDSNPQIAIDASGNSYVVWHGCDKENCGEEPGDLEIYWVKIDGEGTPGTAQKIPPTDPDNIDTMAMVPQIAVDAEGNSYIVWCGMNEEDYDIYWVRIDAEGKIGAIKRISAYPNSNYGDYHPQIAADMSGNTYITWCGSDEDNGEIYWVKIESSGTLETVQRISNYLFSKSYDDSDPQITIDAAGNSYVVWKSFNGGFAEKFDQTICWVKVDAEGTCGKVQRISSDRYSTHHDRCSRIAVDASGNSYVVWESHETIISQIFFTAHLPGPTLTIGTIAIIGIAALAIMGIILARKKIIKVFIRNK
ncbi:MAG: hypothetical protein HXS46_10430, partial [Theionarchaea archaeon]|nr:hypothetical protein [Theionarchaea archaeon]